MVRVNHPPGGKMKLHAEVGPDSRTVRVLKPPGGGSSIVFDEDENMKPVKSKPQPQQPVPQPEPQPKEEAPPAEKQQEQPPQPQQEAGEPKPETNGMNNVDCVKENAAATDSFPTPGTNGQQSPALNGPPVVNGSSATNGSVSSGSTSSMSSHPSGTPKHFNTQTRIFGEEQNVVTPRRRLRDHERSNIFAAEDASTNGTHRPADSKSSSGSSSSSSISSRPSNGTPEARTPDQRQRVPPGGFSTRLW